MMLLLGQKEKTGLKGQKSLIIDITTNIYFIPTIIIINLKCNVQRQSNEKKERLSISLNSIAPVLVQKNKIYMTKPA